MLREWPEVLNRGEEDETLVQSLFGAGEARLLLIPLLTALMMAKMCSGRNMTSTPNITPTELPSNEDRSRASPRSTDRAFLP
jgi:hypothetical protein